MAEEQRGRKILWWTMPVNPDRASQVGRRMVNSTVVWVFVVLAVIVIIGVLAAIN